MAKGEKIFTLLATVLLALGTGTEVAAHSAQEATSSGNVGTGREVGDSPRVYEARPTTAPIEVDGHLDPAEWSGVGEIRLAYEVDPGENLPAPVETVCRLAYDEEHLYLGCRALDPEPGRVRAYVTDRDGIDGHDRIELVLDPFRDPRRGFVFGISALGVQYDASFSQQGSNFMTGGDPRRDPSWDAIWKSAGRIGPDGYSVEAAIPFRSLRFPKNQSEPWGILVSRHWPRSSAVELRSTPLDRGEACVLCQADRLAGLEGVSPGGTVQLSPTLTGSRSDADSGGGAGLEAGTLTADPGLDVRWSPTPELTLNTTANPDFSQVEADAAQLDVNQAFALFVPEKRPFFLEGADVFETPIQAVFSRTVTEPSAGAKLSGKLGRNAVGALVVGDDVNNRILPGVEGSSTAVDESPVTLAVGRLRRDLGESSTVGALVVAREGRGYHNRVAGVDGFFQPSARVTGRLQYLRSWTRDPVVAGSAPIASTGSDDGFAGNAVYGQLTYASRAWVLDGNVGVRERGFRADAGFVPQVGVRGGNVSVQRRFWGERRSWLTRLDVQVGAWSNRTVEGRLLEEGIWFGGTYRGPGQTRITWFPNVFKDGFEGRVYDVVNHWIDIGMRPSGILRLTLGAQVGDAIDFANARAADQVTLQPGVELRLGRRTLLDLSHSFQRLEVPEGGEEISTAHVSEVRAVYNLSTRAFVRGVVQHRLIDRNPETHRGDVATRSRSLFTQLLFSYKVNPQTVFFLGYTDDRGGLTHDPARRTTLEPVGRTLFVKLGYAWRP